MNRTGGRRWLEALECRLMLSALTSDAAVGGWVSANANDWSYWLLNSTPLDYGPWAMYRGDLNGDGMTDLVVSYPDNNSIGILLARGNGNFDKYTIALGLAPTHLRVADFTGDGIADIAVTNQNSHTIGILQGVGNGTFHQIFLLSIGDETSFLGREDLNGDGITDLITISSQSSYIQFYKGAGDGTFQAWTRIAFTGTLGGLATGDFTGDGLRDFIFQTKDDSANTVFHLWRGSRDGTGLPQLISGLDNVSIRALGDFDGDGKLDFVGEDRGSDRLQFWGGVGDGTFCRGPAFAYAGNARLGTTPDLNKDGLADLILAEGPLSNETIHVWKATGDGNFQSVGVLLTGQNVTDLATGNFAGDHLVDIAYSSYQDKSVQALLGRSPQEPNVRVGDISGSWCTMTLPIDGVDRVIPGEGYSLYVDWGDGTETRLPIESAPGTRLTHVYGAGDARILDLYQITLRVRTRRGQDRFASEQSHIIGLPASVLFDSEYYLRVNPDVGAAIQAGTMSNAFEHFLRWGQFEGRQPNAYYQESYYLEHNPDVKAAVERGELQSGFEHFTCFGQREFRPFNWFFKEEYFDHIQVGDPRELPGGIPEFPTFLCSSAADGCMVTQFFNGADYLLANPDVAAAVAAGTFCSAAEHYVRYGYREGRQLSRFFNEHDYLRLNPDVAAAVAAGAFHCGLEHYLLWGRFENRQVTPYFNESYYLLKNPDVAQGVADGNFRSGWEHFINFGCRENRDFLPGFDRAFYLQMNPDVQAAYPQGSEHFLLFGHREPRWFYPGFSVERYLELNPDVAQGLANGSLESALEHWVRWGYAEGRPY